MFVMSVIKLTFVIWDLTSLNYWHSAMWMCHMLKRHEVIRVIAKWFSFFFPHQMLFVTWSIQVIENMPSYKTAVELCWRRATCSERRARVNECVPVTVTKRQLSLFNCIPQPNVSRRETHYEMLLSPWVWIKHVTGVCVQVCWSVPWPFKECSRSTRSTASKLESKYHLSQAMILRGRGGWEQIPTISCSLRSALLTHLSSAAAT